MLTKYQLDLMDGTWNVQELDETFEYEPWMVCEAELGDYGMGDVLQEEFRAVRNTEDPDSAFDDTCASLIAHEKKFDEFDGKNVPEEDKEGIIELLLSELKEQTGID